MEKKLLAGFLTGFMKPIPILIVFLWLFLSLPAQAQECKVDRINITRIKTLQPAQALDEYGRQAISTLITTVATESGAVTKLFGYAAKGSKTATKLHNYEFYGVAIGKKAENKIFSLAVQDPLVELIDLIDQSIDTQDDLIVRIGGMQVVPKSPAQKFQPMLIRQTYPTDFGISHDISASFIGRATVQLIEYDSGSMNDINPAKKYSK